MLSRCSLQRWCWTAVPRCIELQHLLLILEPAFPAGASQIAKQAVGMGRYPSFVLAPIFQAVLFQIGRLGAHLGGDVVALGDVKQAGHLAH